jgi:hypothetical protein
VRALRNTLGVLAGVTLGVVIFWLIVPAVSGYHVGYNSATDHECLTRVVQWCK